MNGSGLPASLVEGLMRLSQGDFSHRMPRSMRRDPEDTAAFFVNAIADELERILHSARAQEERLKEAIDQLSQALTRFASGDFTAQVPRDFSGDAADVLAFLVNNTILELGAIVADSRRRAEEERQRLERLVDERTAELKLLATTDALTGVLNRHRFFEVAEEECSRALRYDRRLSVAMLDLDHFKAINDSYGHAVGDEALWRTAQVMLAVQRRQDHIGRYGGEEFAVLMPETGLDEAFCVLERVRCEIAAIDLRAGAQPVPVRASVGVAEWRSSDSIESALRRADGALYKAKAAGRDRVLAMA